MKNVVTQPRILAKIPSHSNPTKMYEIRLGGDGVVYCTCRAWITNKFCKHLEQYHSDMQQIAANPMVIYKPGQAVPVPNPNAVLKFFETQTQQTHQYNSKFDCAKCGCSKKAIEEFGWKECKPREGAGDALIYNVVQYGIIQGRWDLLTTTRDKKGGF